MGLTLNRKTLILHDYSLYKIAEIENTTSNMLAPLFLIFVVAPIAEIYVLLSAGSAFGVLPVITACVATALIGGWVIRLQGLAAMNAARRDLAEGRPPVDSAVDGALLVVAAPFLMTPGFITDAIGFALLVPQIRRALARFAISRIRQRFETDARIIVIDDRQ